MSPTHYFHQSIEVVPVYPEYPRDREPSPEPAPWNNGREDGDRFIPSFSEHEAIRENFVLQVKFYINKLNNIQ